MPSWLEKSDEPTWEKAKAAALKTYKETDEEFWPVVTSIFKKMGGKVGHKTSEIDQAVETIMAKENLPMNEEPKEIILCKDSGVVLASAKKWEFDQPTTFQWMPGGVTTINAHFNGKPIELTVQADEMTAKAVQSSYEDWFKVRPKQTPFGCVEHREEEAAIRLPKGVAAFEWHDGTVEGEDAGIYCTALPTELGAKNVNGRIHSSWSPSFTADAEYAKASEVGGRLVFPSGARGSRENPARVTGVAFSVGSLTNKPAFRNISPVRAKQTDPEEEGKVDATWSDAARQAAAQARSHHTSMASEHRNKAYAHEASASAHQASMTAHSEDTHGHHRMAMQAHLHAYNMHSDLNGKAHEEHTEKHRQMVEHHLKHMGKTNDHEGMKDHYPKANVRTTETEDLETMYARLAPDNEEVNEIYAKLAEPEDPMASFYESLNGGKEVVRAEEAVVEATGTSEGVKKAWKVRMHRHQDPKSMWTYLHIEHAESREDAQEQASKRGKGTEYPWVGHAIRKHEDDSEPTKHFPK